MRIPRLATRLAILSGLLFACRAQSAAGAQSAVQTQAFETALSGLNSATATPPPAPTEIPTATVPRTPPALPAVYASSLLNPKDTAHTYIAETCQYLKDKWDSTKSSPGTVVMIIMFHGINKGAVTDANDISVADYRRMMDRLQAKGFEAINATQLADFLDTNAKIPPLSVVLIADDRHYAEYFNDHFRPFYDQWGWPVINGWISLEDGIRNLVLAENTALSSEGWVDYQSHGYIHNIPMGDTSQPDFIRDEFERSIADLKTNFGKTPIAIIWPGGGFGARPAQKAREYGYRVGFTTNPRGPVMFNWVPLADQPDPQRPYFLAEGYVSDPRLTLPRYWPSQVLARVDDVLTMGEEAANYAMQNKAVELEYYDISCLGTYGPIP
jgi:peptidoglycan/xylan/chitin deacetylase (PgdA/CDA1 family)